MSGWSGSATPCAGFARSPACGLAELAAEAEVALGLDIEVLSRAGWTPGAARAHLDAFADVAATFAASADGASLGGFLAWLDAAVDEERGLDLGWIEARTDAVQVMTVHAAKGLEWDVVAVPGLVEGAFPAHSGTRTSLRDGGWAHAAPTDKGWLAGLATLPYDLRLQYNKQDLPADLILARSELDDALNFRGGAQFRRRRAAWGGVFETLKGISETGPRAASPPEKRWHDRGPQYPAPLRDLRSRLGQPAGRHRVQGRGRVAGERSTTRSSFTVARAWGRPTC